jgi:adenylate kinase family enzyme
VQRILVIGSPGSGKSTLATELGRRTALPVIHLDQQYWRSGWVEPPADEWRGKLTELLAGERWIMDGNYGGSLDVRLARADTVIDLRLRAWLCIWRLFRRVVGSWRRVRSDMAPGCPEKFDFEFFRYTALFPFGPRKRTDARLATFTGTYIALRSRAEVKRFLASFDAGR